MGDLLKGTWRAEDIRPNDASGRFVRAETQFRNWVTADGKPGPTGVGGFHAAAGRYHLIVSLACPWAHRTLILRKLKGLESMISLSVVHWLLAERGWTFDEGRGVIPDPIFGANCLSEFYVRARPDYSGRVTVPILWDKESNTIVNNESPEIIRMFNSAFDGIGAAEGDYYPADLRAEIDALNSRIYATVNNGVYRVGFAQTQEAYEEAFRALFETLDRLEARLASRQFLCG
jgi:glutathionyl-hydroquinone reductase